MGYEIGHKREILDILGFYYPYYGCNIPALDVSYELEANTFPSTLVDK